MYHVETVNAEEDLGEFLKQEAGGQKEHLKAIMLATSKALQILAEERYRSRPNKTINIVLYT